MLGLLQAESKKTNMSDLKLSLIVMSLFLIFQKHYMHFGAIIPPLGRF